MSQIPEPPPIHLKLLGAGLPRTGQQRLTTALRRLGIPTYNYLTLLTFPKQTLGKWEKFVTYNKIGLYPKEQQRLLAKVIQDYQALIDFPACFYYKEILKYAPTTKVVLTVVEDVEKWADNVVETVFFVPAIYKSLTFCWYGPIVRKTEFPILKRFHHWLEFVWDDKFTQLQGFNPKVKFTKKKIRELLIQAYHEHVEQVKKEVPANRLLIYNVKQGWRPLCNFLNVPVPATPFPTSYDLTPGSRTDQPVKEAQTDATFDAAEYDCDIDVADIDYYKKVLIPETKALIYGPVWLLLLIFCVLGCLYYYVHYYSPVSVPSPPPPLQTSSSDLFVVEEEPPLIEEIEDSP